TANAAARCGCLCAFLPGGRRVAGAEAAGKEDERRSGIGPERRPGGADSFFRRCVAVRPSRDDGRAAAADESVAGVWTGDAAGRDALGCDLEAQVRMAAAHP